jgi:hypothetical protein
VERLELMVDWLGSLAVWSGPTAVDVGLGHSSNSATVAIFTKLHDKTEADGLPKGFAGTFASDQLMLAPLLLQ